MGTCTCTCTCTCACGSHGPPATPPTACATLLVHACATLLLTFLLPPIGLTLPLSWWLARPLKAGSTGVGVLCDVFKGERSAADGTGHARPRTPGHRERQASRARGWRATRGWVRSPGPARLCNLLYITRQVRWKHPTPTSSAMARRPRTHAANGLTAPCIPRAAPRTLTQLINLAASERSTQNARCLGLAGFDPEARARAAQPKRGRQPALGSDPYVQQSTSIFLSVYFHWRPLSF